MDVAGRLVAVRERIEAACRAAGRAPSEVTLVAVSKTRSRDEILAAHAAGQVDFGENRVQEASAKLAPPLPEAVVMHLVGHLQRNKSRDAARLFRVIHSLDDVRTIARLDHLASSPIDVLLQVKLAEEESKSGARPEEVPALTAAVGQARQLRLYGLMTVPPLGVDPRPYFDRLRELRDQLGGVAALPHLSMGMSGDFEQAIACGATIVRVGTAIFGPRLDTGPDRPPRGGGVP